MDEHGIADVMHAELVYAQDTRAPCKGCRNLPHRPFLVSPPPKLPMHFPHEVLEVKSKHIRGAQLRAEQVHQPGLAAPYVAPQVKAPAGLQPEPVWPLAGKPAAKKARRRFGVEAVGQLAKPREDDVLGRVDGERATLHGAIIILLQRLRGAQEEAIIGSSPECLEDTSGNRRAKSLAIFSTR